MNQKLSILKLSFVISFIMLTHLAYSQTDSTWSVMILKKDNSFELREHMAEYSPTGFYLYRNCFYDLDIQGNKFKTLRLIDIRQDSLVFVGISPKDDVHLNVVSQDTSIIDYRKIKRICLVKEWYKETGPILICNEFHFVFFKSPIRHSLASKTTMPNQPKNECIPRLSAYGITYHTECFGKLYYQYGIKPEDREYGEDKASAGMVAVTILKIIGTRSFSVRR